MILGSIEPSKLDRTLAGMEAGDRDPGTARDLEVAVSLSVEH
jgi:hypothetical protein